MADEDDNDQVDSGLEISDEDAERLLADAVGERRPRAARDSDSADDDGDDDSDDGLREQGRRALESMKEQRKAARAERDKARRDLDEMRKRLERYENDGKSELQRLQEAAESHKTRAEKVEAALRRREIAEERAPAHATLAQIKAVAKRLAGDTEDDLEADADELFELLAPAPPLEKEKAPRTPSRPKERLRPGNADPEEDDEETDPRKLADAIRRNR